MEETAEPDMGADFENPLNDIDLTPPESAETEEPPDVDLTPPDTGAESVVEESPVVDVSSITDMGGFEIPSTLNQNDKAEFEETTAEPANFMEEDGELTLTETELALFKQNLLKYPLNLRIAVEELVIDDNYHNSIIFDIIHQVIKRVTARQLANQMEKLAGVSVSVPRDFEHRSAEWYVQYRQTSEYQLKNRIIPAAFVIFAIAVAGFAVFTAIRYFMYQPIMAERLYKEGYTLIENGFYPQSEEKFDAALKYRVKRNWFFKFADGYRKKQQFERAELMYRNLLIRYNHDKEAGLRYAEMELYDRGNYRQAEEAVRREVLDYHINDSDGMLLLGDIALEWGTDQRIDAKLEEARETYATLIQTYGVQDTYLARMMRYFIRKDNLREVLPLKSHFMAQK
jgi:tetratricopeptide (TPR) repeat protein